MPPSVEHEALVQLFRDRPELAAELLRDALHLDLPTHTRVRIESAELTEIAPAEYRADLVLLLEASGVTTLGIILEVQLERKERKRFTWPAYATSLRARFECDVCVLVATPSLQVAQWADRVIPIGPGGTFRPLVLGPSVIPAVRNADAARRVPELAVLSAMAHGQDADTESAAEIALAALKACLGLDTERGAFYADVVRVALGDKARAALEALMQSPEHREFQSEFARKYVSLGKAEGVLAVLEARGLSVTAEERARVLNSKDIAELDRWLKRAVTVASVAELLSQ